MPSRAVTISTVAEVVSAANPLTGWSRATLRPRVLIIRRPPAAVPAAIVSRPVIPHPSVERFDPGAFFQPVGAAAGRAASWRRFARLSNRHAIPDVWMLNQFRERARRERVAPDQRAALGTLLPKSAGQEVSVALIDATDLEAASSGHKKKTTGKYSASRAALGGRNAQMRTESRFFVGY